jgi:hypothetical protein
MDQEEDLFKLGFGVGLVSWAVISPASLSWLEYARIHRL